MVSFRLSNLGEGASVKQLKTGAMIALAAGSLFASACKKEDKAASQPAPAPQQESPTAADKPAEPKPAEPAVAKPDDPSMAKPAEKVAKVDCAGVNECKGQGTCKQEGHGCGGQNECKGKGVLAMTEEECKAKGGTVASK